MKKLILLFGAILLMTGFSTQVMAQATVTAATSATIISPITLTWVADMNFGNVAINNTTGTVVLVPAGTRSATGGVTLPATAGTVTAAQFTIGGEDRTYSIGLPTSPITLSDGEPTPNTMTVGTFTSTPSGTGTSADGQTILVGATLNVGTSQVAGTYTNASDLFVTVNYN